MSGIDIQNANEDFGFEFRNT